MGEMSEFLCSLQPSRPGIQPSFVQIPTSAAQSTFDSSRGVTSPRGGLVHCLLAPIIEIFGSLFDHFRYR